MGDDITADQAMTVRKSTFGTLSVLVSFVPWASALAILALKPVCGGQLKLTLQSIFLIGAPTALAFGIIGLVRDTTKRFALYGTIITLCFIAFLIYMA